MSASRLSSLLILVVASYAHVSASPSPPYPGNDIVIFKNGDTLTGNVLQTTPASIQFVSPSVGNLILKWSDIKSLEIHHPMNITSGAKGSIQSFTNPTMTVTASRPTLTLDIKDDHANSVSVANVQTVIGPDKCASGIQPACTGWKVGKLKVSTAFLESTQEQQSYAADITLLRNWYPQAAGWPHEETLIQLLPSYDDKKKDGKPRSSNITQNYQGKIQQFFFSKNDNFFAKTVADLYHNNSLGMYFQQAYGGGVGVIVHDVELNADVRFIGEHFYRPTPSVGLIGMQFSERYSFGLDFIRAGTTLNESGLITPVFNAARSWQAQGDVELVIPISARLGISSALSDNYIENAPAGFRRNYLKTTVGLQFTPPPKH